MTDILHESLFQGGLADAVTPQAVTAQPLITPLLAQASGQSGNPVETASSEGYREGGYNDAINIGGIAISGSLVLAGVGTLLGYWFLKSFLCICKPNEVLVISGRKSKTADGHEVGYRVLAGGRAIRIPILETIERMNVNTMPVQVEIQNAYAKGGTPLDIQAIANIKISSDPNIVGNAIERFLGSKRNEIIRVARETLEGNLRGVVATLTPEQVNEDRLEFAERISADVRRDLNKLGLEIDTFKIQSVADHVDYLSSLGRERIAMILRDAEMAESDAMEEANRTEAECEESAEVALSADRTVVQEKQNELRELQAKLEQTAKSEEEVTIAAGREQRAKFEQKLQAVRSELERLRLQADEILPAEANRKAQMLLARGEAAPFAENAKAEAQANELLAQVWKDIGSDAPELLVIQQLETILQEAVKIPGRLHLKQIDVVDNGDGRSLANLVNLYPDILTKFLESVNQTLGINVLGTLTESKTLTPTLSGSSESAAKTESVNPEPVNPVSNGHNTDTVIS